MFYIKKLKKDKHRDFILIHLGPTFIVFLAFLGITVISWHSARNYVAQQKHQLLSRKTAEIKKDVESQLNTYQDTLRASEGLFGASNEVSREEWKTFISQFVINGRYPGIQSVGFIKQLQPNEVAAHEATVQAEGFPSYKVHPSGQRDAYTSVLLIEPYTADNAKAIGSDMFTEPARKKAMELARDTGEPALTDRSVLVKDRDKPQPAFLIFNAVYAKDRPVSSTEERRTSITGYVYAPIRSAELFDGLFRGGDSNFGFQIYDKAQNSESLMYESADFARISAKEGTYSLKEDIKINNASWTIVANVDQAAVEARDHERPVTIIWGGLSFSVLVAGFIYLLLINRTRALSHKDELEVQEAKDELLALASHQLRTPATGVKQYVGMLREGYGGTQTTLQKELIEKAYMSNERQLNTINEMLFIARADAGDMKITSIPVNISDMIEDIVREHQAAIKERHQKLTVSLPKRPITINADKNYLRMAVENIVSNATKYTPEKGKINITLKSKKESIFISISDTGVGVSKQDLPLLFQKFSRIPNELTNKVSGSGIGLYLARQVIEAHGGTIDLNSELGSGSRFDIEIPRYRQES